MVVPERGRPITMTGFSISMSRISGCCVEQVVDAQPVRGVADAVAEHQQRPRPVRSGSASISDELQAEPLAEVVGPEVVEAGALDGGGAARRRR